MSKQRRFVYKFTFPDGKVYIGSTYSTDDRWQYNGMLYQNQNVGKAIKEFGWDNIQREIVFESDDEAAVIQEEKRLIRENSGNSYNLADSPDWKYTSTKHYGCRGGYAHIWTINGIVKPAQDWCKIYRRDLSNTLVKMRKYNMTPFEALIAPSVPRNHLKHSAEYWNSIGFSYGNDSSSFITPVDEWPDDFKIAHGMKKGNPSPAKENGLPDAEKHS